MNQNKGFLPVLYSKVFVLTINFSLQVGLGKRTSSSSGFSSARSDRSESSVSVSSDTNFPSPAALRRIQESEVIKQMGENTGNSTRSSLR